MIRFEPVSFWRSSTNSGKLASSKDRSVPIGFLQLIVLLIFFGLGLVLNSTEFLPTYSPEGGITYDELAYIGSGRDLIAHGTLRVLGLGPMISFVYGAIYVIANFAFNWVLTASVIGRLTAYTLMFVGTWQIGRELQYRQLTHPLIMVGLLTVLPVYYISLTNPNYLLFMSFAGLAFWRTLTFLRTHEAKAIVAASAFLGCAMMVRPDPVLAVAFVAAACMSAQSKRALIETFVLAAVPVCGLVGLFLLVFRLRTGMFDTGMESCLYLMFETSYQLLQHTTGQEITSTSEHALAGARQAFGTPEQNHQSVLIAIARNPAEFIRMVWANTTHMTIPYFYFAFGVRQPLIGFIVILFALRGVAELIKQKRWRLVGLFVLWFCQLGVYLVTMSFPSFLIFSYYEVFALTSIGLYVSVTNLHRRRERVIWLFGLIAILWIGAGSFWKAYIASLSPNLQAYPILADTTWPAVTIVILGLTIAVSIRREVQQRVTVLALTALFAITLALEWPSRFRWHWPGSQTGYEGQAIFLRQYFPADSRVLAYAGFAPVLAKMTWVPMTIDMRDLNPSPEVLRTFLLKNEIAAIAIDPLFTESNPWQLSTAMRANAAIRLREIYSSKDGNFAIFQPAEH